MGDLLGKGAMGGMKTKLIVMIPRVPWHQVTFYENVVLVSEVMCTCRQRLVAVGLICSLVK